MKFHRFARATMFALCLSLMPVACPAGAQTMQESLGELAAFVKIGDVENWTTRFEDGVLRMRFVGEVAQARRYHFSVTQNEFSDLQAAIDLRHDSEGEDGWVGLLYGRKVSNSDVTSAMVFAINGNNEFALWSLDENGIRQDFSLSFPEGSEHRVEENRFRRIAAYERDGKINVTLDGNAIVDSALDEWIDPLTREFGVIAIGAGTFEFKHFRLTDSVAPVDGDVKVTK